MQIRKTVSYRQSVGVANVGWLLQGIATLVELNDFVDASKKFATIFARVI